MSSVTIGDQKFIKVADRGWVDAKTKQPADKGLLKLLDRLALDEPEVKKLRVKIDKRVEPVSIGSQKFVYDVNQGWLDEKTKVRAPDSLQRTLSNLVPRFGKDDTADIDLTAGFGMAGQAGLQKTKEAKTPQKSGGGTLVMNRNASINKPLVAMINQLASIDSYLKQQLQNKQIITAKDIAQAREANIEAKTAPDQLEEIKPDAKPEPSKLAMLGGAGLAALIAMQFDPVKETIKGIVDFSTSVGEFVGNIAKTLNTGFEWLLGDKAASRETESVSTTPTAPTQQPQQAPTMPLADTKPAAPAIPVIGSPPEPVVPAVAQDTEQNVTAPAPASPKAATSTSGPSGGAPAPMAKPSSVPPSQPAASPSAPSTGGLKAKGGRTSGKGTASAPEAQRIAASQVSPGGGGKMSENVGKLFTLGGGITGNAKNLQNWDPKFEASVVSMLQEYVAAGNAPPVMTSGYRYPGDQAKISTGYIKAAPGKSRHERGLAVDFNSTDVNRMKSMGLLSKYGLDQPYPGKDPVHIQQAGAAVGGTDPIYSMVGEDGGVVADLAGPVISAMTETFEMGKKLFGKVGKALIGAENYEAPTTKGGTLSKLAKAGAIEKTATMADSRTPPPPPAAPKPVSLPNINPDKSSPVIQTPATDSDMSGVNYYLQRFGFNTAESEMSR